MADNNIDYNPAPVDAATDAELAAEVAAAQAEADAIVAENNQTVDDQDPFEARRLQNIEEEDAEPRVFEAADLGVEETGFFSGLYQSAEQSYNRATLRSEDAVNAAQEAATIKKAQDQATFQARYKQPGNADWRVRLVLAQGADYLYKDPESVDILKPLKDSNGVIFPYTPKISTSYSANYDKYDLTHSNHRGYFYKNSAVNDISITATFTAQDTNEAQYMLAVIHFFRSVTKMFYGKDAQRGAPPPIVYLTGYGDYQFNGHPCLVSNFQYELPSDVDYIRANNPNNYGTDLLNRRTASTTSSNPIASVASRLANAFLTSGALPPLPFQGVVPASVNNTNRSTYVPTKLEMTLTLLPVQTRAQISQNFSLKGFANGNLLKGGYW